MLNIFPIKAFSDNYIWTLVEGSDAFVVDPGDPSPVEEKLQEMNLNLQGIIITHHHFDHSGGIEKLQSVYDCDAYGPSGGHIKGINKPLLDNEIVNVLGTEFKAMSTPGHTNDQLAYFHSKESNSILFCGDTLFAGGCGRLFEGTPAEMDQSLKLFSNLPKETQVFCGHEYTESNLIFAAEVEKNNEDIANRLQLVKKLREKDLATLPSSIELELKTNPFMRVDVKSVIDAATDYSDTPLNSDSDVLGAIRDWKDNF